MCFSKGYNWKTLLFLIVKITANVIEISVLWTLWPSAGAIIKRKVELHSKGHGSILSLLPYNCCLVLLYVDNGISIQQRAIIETDWYIWSIPQEIRVLSNRRCKIQYKNFLLNQ